MKAERSNRRKICERLLGVALIAIWSSLAYFLQQQWRLFYSLQIFGFACMHGMDSMANNIYLFQLKKIRNQHHRRRNFILGGRGLFQQGRHELQLYGVGSPGHHTRENHLFTKYLNIYQIKMYPVMQARNQRGRLTPENFKTLHSNFDIYRNFQRIKIKFCILVIFGKILIWIFFCPTG